METLNADEDHRDREAVAAMSTVYVVKDDCCGGCGEVHAVFSTRPAADAYVKAEQPHVRGGHTLSVEEHELDEEWKA